MAAMRERMRMAERMKDIRRKVVVMSGKGGVGKTTVAANLACALAAKGTVGVLDADVTGPDLPKILGVEHVVIQGGENGMDPAVGPRGVKVISMAHILADRDQAVIWRGPLKIKALKQMLMDVNWGALDYLVIDLPPGTSDEPLSIAQELPDADGAVVVTTPQDVALLDVRKSISFAQAVNLPILGIVENMSGMACPHCGGRINLFKEGGGENAARQLNLPFLGRIPFDPEVVVGGDAGKPFVIDHPDSPVAAAFEGVVQNIEAQLAKAEETA
jgi:Mrp family chromosome partitioning ATPase